MINDTLLALVKKQFIQQGERAEDFEDLVAIWEGISFIRETIAEQFGNKQLHLISDCCEFLLRNLTPLERGKVLAELKWRLENKAIRDDEIIKKWSQKKLIQPKGVFE